MSAPDHVDVTAAVHEGEWRVRVELPAQGQVFLTPAAAKDASQRLFHLALEISEREGQPQGATEAEALRAQVRQLKEQLRIEKELARGLADARDALAEQLRRAEAKR